MRNFIKATITVIALSLLSPIASYAERKYTYDEEFVFKDGDVEIRVQKAQILTVWSGMTLTLLITNNGTEEIEFNASDFEILNPKTKQAYYSCTKDKEMVSVPYYLTQQNILTNNTSVKADRAVKGIILILASPDELKSLKDFDLIYKGQTLKVTSKK